MLTFQNVLGHWQARRLSALEAAEMLGMSERSFRRYRRRYEAGLDGLFDEGRQGVRAPLPADRIEWVLELYRTRHMDQALPRPSGAHHGFAWSYTWTKTTLQRLVSGTQARRPPSPAPAQALLGMISIRTAHAMSGWPARRRAT